MKLSLDTTYGELTEKKQELVSLKILNETLEHECCEATEEIVVSTSCFDVSISITLPTTTILCSALTSAEIGENAKARRGC